MFLFLSLPHRAMNQNIFIKNINRFLSNKIQVKFFVNLLTVIIANSEINKSPLSPSALRILWMIGFILFEFQVSN